MSTATSSRKTRWEGTANSGYRLICTCTDKGHRRSLRFKGLGFRAKVLGCRVWVIQQIPVEGGTILQDFVLMSYMAS